MATLFIAFCMIIFGIILVYLKPKRKRRIPSPNVIPLIGGIFEFLRVFGPTAHRTLMSRFNELGPIYQFGFLKNKMTFLFTLKDLLKLKQIEGLNPVHIDFKHLRLYRTQHDLPLGLLVSSGDEWQRQRKYIGKALLSSAVLKGYLNAVDEVAVQTVQDMTPIILCDKTVDMEDIIGTYVLKGNKIN